MTPPSPANPPFVGRDAELAELTHLLNEAAAGRPQIALIRGPAGIGKTRLAEEAAAAGRARGFLAATGRGWQDGDAPPLWPWRAILRELGAADGILDEGISRQEPGRFARFLVVLDHLVRTGRTAPVLVVVDDAHLADAASLQLAVFLGRERNLPLLLLLAGRDDVEALAPEVGGLIAELAGHAHVLHLTGLPPEAVAACLEAYGDTGRDPELVRTAHAVTRGNPLHLRSLALQSASARGGLHGGLERAIRTLLDRLTDDDRRRIATAALLDADVSIHEVARIAGVPPAAAAESLERAAELGLVDRQADRFRFVHELVRREAASFLPPADRLDAHARAAASLAGHEPDRIARRAHHALEAAGRSGDDAARAVAAAREAAAILKGADGFEAAAALLRRAIDVQTAALPGSPSAPLAVEHAEAVLASGRLADARPLFQHAARVADREGDPAALARAALGLGGVWISEHRQAADVEAMLALQRRALDALPAGERVLRARLTMRLAAEDAYRGSDVRPVLAALAGVRLTGDAHATAEALSLAHHVLLTPEHTLRRLVMANEQIALATVAGDSLLTLIGVCWRAVDLFQIGHPRAPAALDELRVRADALRCGSVQFIARGMAVMLAIRAGEFARAESDAAACFALGSEVGDADALAYHGAHLSAIRYFQGREAELAELAASISTSPTLIGQRERAFASAAALFALRAGDAGPGRALLDGLAREGLGSIPASSSWLATVVGVAELALELDDVVNANAAYGALLPYAHLPVMPSLAIVCFGSVQRFLGIAALACGNLNLAVEHFHAAVSANDELGHRPAAIQSRAELGLARLRRGIGRDRERGRTLLQSAIDAGSALGMTGLVGRWRQAMVRLLPVGGETAAAASLTQTPGGQWRVSLDGEVATVPDRVGLRYLDQLLAAPDRGIPALALVVQGDGEPVDAGPDPVMDAKARAAVRARIESLRALPDPSPDERDELEVLARELARASGLGGRLRSFADAPERARTAVRKAIKRAIDEIGAANPTLGRHLAERVETGTVCCYHRRPRA